MQKALSSTCYKVAKSTFYTDLPSEFWTAGVENRVADVKNRKANIKNGTTDIKNRAGRHNLGCTVSCPILNTCCQEVMVSDHDSSPSHDIPCGVQLTIEPAARKSKGNKDIPRETHDYIIPLPDARQLQVTPGCEYLTLESRSLPHAVEGLAPALSMVKNNPQLDAKALWSTPDERKIGHFSPQSSTGVTKGGHCVAPEPSGRHDFFASLCPRMETPDHNSVKENGSIKDDGNQYPLLPHYENRTLLNTSAGIGFPHYENCPMLTDEHTGENRHSLNHYENCPMLTDEHSADNKRSLSHYENCDPITHHNRNCLLQPQNHSANEKHPDLHYVNEIGSLECNAVTKRAMLDENTALSVVHHVIRPCSTVEYSNVCMHVRLSTEV